jgi:uncharacterized protein YdaU (DUF1376 family)
MRRPWMPVYIGDHLADTSHLSTLEVGAYDLLIRHYWHHGKLPNDDIRLARITKLTPQEWNTIRATLAALFGANWRHRRTDEELRKTNEQYARRAAAGKQGGIAKSLNTKETRPSIATAKPVAEPSKSPLISPAAFTLADEYRAAIKADRDDPTWAGLAYSAEIWISRGYDRNLILSTGADLAARKPGKGLKYHCIVIERTQDERSRGEQTPRLPLMVVERGNAKASEYGPNDWRTRRDNAQRAYEKLGARVAADEGGEEGDPPITRVVQDPGRRQS